MSTQSTLTVTGFVGSSVRFSIGQEGGGVPYASFRLGSTQRVFDRAAQAYKDTPTQWYTVKVWRHVATNVVQSLRKGDPVVVTGRLRTQEWSNLEGAHTTLVIEAAALGHDLVFGTTRLERTLGPGAHRTGPAGDEPVVADVSGLAEAPEPGPDEPDGDELAGDEPDGDELAGDELAGDEPAGDEPDGDERGDDERDDTAEAAGLVGAALHEVLGR